MVAMLPVVAPSGSEQGPHSTPKQSTWRLLEAVWGSLVVTIALGTSYPIGIGMSEILERGPIPLIRRPLGARTNINATKNTNLSVYRPRDHFGNWYEKCIEMTTVPWLHRVHMDGSTPHRALRDLGKSKSFLYMF